MNCNGDYRYNQGLEFAGCGSGSRGRSLPLNHLLYYTLLCLGVKIRGASGI